jgi:hypothetical protein
MSLARDLGDALASDGVDRDDPEAVAAWIRGLHSRGPSGGGAIAQELAELDGPVAAMPPVLLAPRVELEAAARAVACMQVLVAGDRVDHPLAVWEAAVSAALTRLAVGPIPDGEPWRGSVAERVVEVLVLLYAARRPVPVGEALESVWSDVAVDLDVDLDDRELVGAWLQGMGAELDEVLAHLAELGVVERTDPSLVRLTDLGAWAVHRLLVASGVDAPVAGEWADADAETMLGGCLHLDPGHAELEIDLWAERRGDRAVPELVSVVRTSLDPAVQALALDALDLFADEADAALEALRDDPDVGPVVAAWFDAR